MISQSSLRHLAFFDELSRLDETDDGWREVSAGLVVLRLVDRWLEEGASVVAADAWGYTSVLEAIEEIPAGRPVRGILRSMVDAMAEAGTPGFRTVAPRLLAYARALDFDAKWTLAIDVYHTVIGSSDPMGDSDTVIAAHLRLGFCLRQTGEVDRSATAYGIAGKLAEQTNDMVGVLRARIGDAKIALLRGNLPRAEMILDSTIEDAERNGLSGVQSMALQDRASAAEMRGDYELAIRLAYRAFEGSETERNRDRILHDIANAFNRLGVRTAARDAFSVILATSQEQYLRWSAAIALLGIAADDGIGPVFERFRQELSGQTLPPALRAEFEFTTGRAYLTLGHFEDATAWLELAATTANASGMYQMAFESEAELVSAKSARRRATQSRLREFQPETNEVAAALHEMHELVAARKG